MAWSKYQEDVFKHVQTSSNHLVVEAVAGSGKTTTLEEAVKRIARNKKILVTAFNVSTREALQARMPSHVVVKNFNQLGFYSVIRMWGKVEVNKYRQRDLIKAIVPDKLMSRSVMSDVSTLVRMAMARLAHTDQEIADLMDMYDCRPADETLLPQYVQWTQEVLSRSRTKSIEISLDDQIYIPAYYKFSGTQADVVLADEFQDCNPAQLQLIQSAIKPGGKLLAVGDSRQAIYAFRGADENTMQQIRETLKADSLPLSITYRCPVRVVQLVQTIVPQFEAAPGAKMGAVNVVTEKQFLEGVKPGHLVLSRLNAVLATYAMKLLVSGKKCLILGKNLSSNLVTLLDRSSKLSLKECLPELSTYVNIEQERLITAKKEDKAEELLDSLNVLYSLSEGLDSRYQLIQRIQNLFGDENEKYENMIVCSSVHKAKGLEFDTVWMFESTFYRGTVEGENLYYVAATRAKDTLNLVQTPTRNGKMRPSLAYEIWGEGEDYDA